MAKAEGEMPQDSAESGPPSKPLPKVESVDPEDVTKDEESVDIPQPWFLALLTVAMSAMTSITVAGSLFFLLAAPEKVSPHCYERELVVSRGFCTASTVCFWTYPVVCCLFVVLVYAKNMIDQRTYYEFLLHRIVIGYGPPANAIYNPTVLGLLLYAVMAFSALGWHSFHHGGQVEITHVYSSLAYITPIISFLAVIFTSWSIQGKLITLPNFLASYEWAMKHLDKSRCYPVEDLHHGYNCLESEMNLSDEVVDTPRMVALVEHFTQTVQSATPTPRDVEANADGDKPTTKPAEESNVDKARAMVTGAVRELSKAEQILVEEANPAKREWVYWEFRMLFHPRLQDERSRSFRNWALAYVVSVIFAIILSVYIFICCLITCLEIERVLVPGSVTWGYMHGFSLRPDFAHAEMGGAKSLKQVAASVALSALQTGGRSFNKPPGMFQFHIGAAA